MAVGEEGDRGVFSVRVREGDDRQDNAVKLNTGCIETGQ